ncbi:MAG: OmpA family protein [Steroidobacteraceae bacterium]
MSCGEQRSWVIRFSRAARAVACALFLLQWQSISWAQSTTVAQCQRLVPGTIACNQEPAGHAPPNTERAAPNEPPSDAVISRLIAARAAVPSTQPAQVLQLLDAGNQSHFASGSDELTALTISQLDTLIASLRASRPRKVLVTAHTDSQRLVREAKRHFATNQRLSEARAASVVRYLQSALGLPEEAFAIEGFGDSRPIAENDTDAGRARNRRAEVSVWIEQPVASEAAAAAPAASIESTSGCIGDNANQLPPVRITVDGVPVDRREGSNEADRQRCVDVALARADVQVRYDPLQSAPSLNVIAIPQNAVVGKPVRFTTYTNYPRYIAHAEMRLFAADQSAQQKPIVVIPVDIGGEAVWVPPAIQTSLLRLTTVLSTPRYLSYVLRVYGHDGRFDETKPRQLDLSDTPPVARPDSAKIELEMQRAAYGENTRVVRNIEVRGGAITVSGKNVPAGDLVSVQGLAVPLDDERRFVARQIVPAGPQQVTVKILNDNGEGLEFTRNLTVATDDSFFVGLADFTAGSRGVSGPIDLVTGDPNLAGRNYTNGELAFYYKGLVKGQWLLTAAADTKDEPVHDLFSNFARKDPEDLLRRIDPDRYYPTYGDDSTTVQDAPTSGKFYVRLEKGDSAVLWGDFKTQLTGTDFIQYARTLYGLDIRYRSQEATALGEKKRSVDAFWADPGTLESRQEFRGTGGSLYYLQNQDISIGSEQLMVEVRDKDSGLVLSVTQLIPAQDYDINYMQGRILLHSALSATANAATVVHSGQLDGDPQYLVATYEYAPDFSNISSLSLGGHASEWFGDHWQLGISSFHQGAAGEEQDLRGVNAMWRYMPGTYIKSEYAHSDGVGSPTLTSITGGLTFNPVTTTGAGANAERIEAAVDLAEVTDGMKGKANVYYQQRDANFSGPGQLTPGVGVTQEGGALRVPLSAATQVAGKFDATDSAAQTLRSGEFGVEHKLDANWRVAVGARVDDRENIVPNLSPTLSQNGDRTDMAVTLGYHPSAPAKPADGASSGPPSPALRAAAPTGWDIYGFVQDTLQHTETRPENDRVGVGGSYPVSDALHVGAEASDGSLGGGGKLSTDYHIDDRSNVYLNYTLAADQPDALNIGRSGTLTSGTRYRYDDATSVFGEERMQTGAGSDSLTHAYGVDFSPSKQWTYGLKFEHGTISDPLAGDIDLSAVAATLQYTRGKIKYSGALEWRNDDSSINGASRTELTRNSLTYQADPNWRLFAKLNWSETNGQVNTALNAAYHEFIVGAAWRPIANDAWNTLFKFTILDDQPSGAQVSSVGNTVDYAQHSQVFDIDTNYQCARWLSFGVKYAIRTGELKPMLTPGDWYASQAQLWVVRTDFLFPRQWDGLLEVRRLAILETDDSRSGILLGGYRHLGDHLKIGAGYNFTNYSDNLTDLAYRSHGFFVNTIGKF